VHLETVVVGSPGSAGILAGVFVFVPPHRAGKDAGPPRFRLPAGHALRDDARMHLWKITAEKKDAAGPGIL